MGFFFFRKSLIWDTDGVVESKCPYSAKDIHPEAAIQQIPYLRKIFDKKEKDCTNKSHPYYYQVIGQLEVTERSYCNFAIWTSIDVKFVKVGRDQDFWSSKMKPFLSRFYMECLLPEIVDSRRKRNMPIKDPDYILRAKCAVKQKREQKDSHVQVKKRRKIIKNGTLTVVDDLTSNLSQTIGTPANTCSSGPAATWTPIEIDDNRKPSKLGIAILEGLRRDIRVDEVTADILLPESLLNDTSIDLFQNIVEGNSDFRFHPTSYFAYYTYIEPYIDICKLLGEIKADTGVVSFMMVQKSSSTTVCVGVSIL